jgi:heme/copper-type cytochrome/quinol oxidase subunit 3
LQRDKGRDQMDGLDNYWWTGIPFLSGLGVDSPLSSWSLVGFICALMVKVLIACRKAFLQSEVTPALVASDGAFAAHKFFNFFFSITGFHGAHVASGVVLNIIILLNTINGTYEKRGHYEMVEKVGLYWHFVDLVWVFVFTCFYLL